MVMWLQCSICLWIFLWPSAGCLSPPQNVTVEFLDFQGRVHWLAGGGNTNHTHYSVEIRALGESWWQPCNCSNPVAMACPLDIPLEDLLKNYNVRVRAELEEQTSDWKYLENTVQPYSDTVLSAPGLELWVENQSLCVELHHPAQNIFKFYNITLLMNVQEHNATVMSDIESGSKRVFSHLSPDHTYCLLASANHYSIRRHMTAQGCVNLTRHRPDTQGQQRLVGMAVGVFLLLAVLIGLIAVTRYVLKSTDHTPTALGVCVRSAGCMVTPEQVMCHPVMCGTATSGYLRAVMTFHLDIRLETETLLPCSLDNHLETETLLPCSLDDYLETETLLSYIGLASPLTVFTLTMSGGNTKWTQDQRLGATSPHTLLSLSTSPSPLSSSSLSPSLSSPSSTLSTGYALAWDSVSNQSDTETHTDRTTDRTTDITTDVTADRTADGTTDRWDRRSQQSQDRLSDCKLYSPELEVRGQGSCLDVHSPGASLCSFSTYEPRPDPTLNLP
uniref:Fibronectin type-III domain-containing protein n=1 Tax=Oncorhynchus kisutch TaxID=8019 RepID=A0A8C7I280_ONCKI